MNRLLHKLSIALLITFGLSQQVGLSAGDANRSKTVITVSLKSFEKEKPKDLTVEYQNKSGKEISRIQGTLTFADTKGNVLFTTGVTQDRPKPWAPDAKSPEKPFYFFNVPAALVSALEQDKQSVVVTFTAAALKYKDGTEEKF